MRVLRGFVGWLLGAFVALAMSLSGCSCGAVAIQPPAPYQGNTDAGDDTKIPPVTEPAFKLKTYQVSGVSSLTFYPKSSDGKEGSFGGYLLFYSKPQETSLMFLDMKDGMCLFRRGAGKKSEADFRGLDAGTSLKLRIGEKSWELPSAPFDPTQEKSVYYAAPSLETLVYPYQSSMAVVGQGGEDIKALSLDVKTPTRLVVKEPLIDPKGTTITKQKDLALSWEFAGDAPFLAVRINQYDPGSKQTLSLSCRLPNTNGAPSSATIPAKELAPFAADPTGEQTNIYFFSGNYQFLKVEELPHPVLMVVEAITTTPLILE